MSNIVIGKDVQQAYESIVSGDKATSWAVFSYDGQTELRLQASGSEDLTEFADEFSDGKLQYAFMRVNDPNSKLPKMVLIGWCGEGAPRKGVFQQHFSSVAKQLTGYHVQITARSDEDLTEDKIMKKVEDASGAKYSVSGTASVFGATSSRKPPTTNSLVNQLKGQNAPSFNSKKPTQTEPRLPPSASSKPSFNSPKSTIKKTDDWDAPSTNSQGAKEFKTAQQDQSEPLHETIKSSYQPIGRPDINALRAQGQSENPSLSQPTSGTSYKPVEVPKTGSLADRMSAFSGNSAPAPDNSTPRKTSNPLASRFGGAVAGTKPAIPTSNAGASKAVGGLAKNFGSEGGKTPAQLWAERKARERGESIPEPVKEAPVKAATYDAEDRDADVDVSTMRDRFASTSVADVPKPAQRSIPTPIPRPAAPEPEEDIEEMTPDALEASDEEAPTQVPQARPPPPNMNTRPGATIPAPVPLPRDPSPEPEEIDEEPQREASPEPEPVKNDFKARLAESLGGAGTGASGLKQSSTSTGTTVPATKTSSKPSAKAIYDYEAQEDNELGFAEGDVVTEIEMVDEGWWSGERHGQSGLFPSNYVELIDGDEAGHGHGHSQSVGGAEGAAADDEEDETDARSHASEQATPTTTTVGKGQCATAVYEYEAAEEGEIGFAEGETVTAIDQIDEGWWKGTNARGEEGLFPSNYVELV